VKEPISIQTPLDDRTIEELRAGDPVLINGTIYTARDAAHKRLFDLLQNGGELPFDLAGQVIYYVGPTPAKPGAVIGAAGPTTAYRMDAYAPTLIAKGLKGMIGKGSRGADVVDALKRCKAIYFAATGGAGALISKRIKEVDMVAYEDLGTEAIRRMVVEDFPAIVANDIYGGDLYEDGLKRYRRPQTGIGV
jgi:fumarate hydratase subunit beta